MKPGTLLVRVGRDPYRGCAIRIEPEDPGRGGAVKPGSVLVRRLMPDGWSEGREWMHGELRGWVEVDELPPRDADHGPVYPDGYFARLVAANVDALVHADHRSPSEVARAVAPESSRPQVVLARLRGLDDSPTMPTDAQVAALVSGLELSSHAPIFELGESRTLAEHSTAELVHVLRARGHTVVLDQDPEPTRTKRAVAIDVSRSTRQETRDAMDDAVVRALNLNPMNKTELARAMRPRPCAEKVTASVRRLMLAKKIERAGYGRYRSSPVSG